MELKKVRSVRSDVRAYVRFINNTDRTVELIWINFSGNYVKYRLLECGNYIDINTYKMHPWIALDSETKDYLHIEKQFIYEPKTTREHLIDRYPDKNIPPNYEARIRARITVPVHSLRYRTLLELRNYFKEPEDVDCLELPKPLLDDLKRVINQRNNQRLMPMISIA